MNNRCVLRDRIRDGRHLPTRGFFSVAVHTAVLTLLLMPLAGATPRAFDDDQDIHQTVARVSLVMGDVSFSRGDDPDEWQSAEINVPMTLGDRIYSGQAGRLELQISGGNHVRIGPNTDLTALNMTEETKQFSVTEGVASFQIRGFEEDEIIEVDTPNAAVTFERTGLYRISVDHDGNTRVAILQGRATVSAGGGEMSLNAGEEIDIDGVDDPQYDIVSIAPPDRFDDWVSERTRRLDRTSAYRYVNQGVVGAEDLDEYGRWVPISGYGMVWTPTVVVAGWTPYSQGRWIWQDPWGWTWVAAEPWGWAPCHYGRWFFRSSRWYWTPVQPTVQRVVYAPALVAFVGGPRASVSVSIGVGAIGWFPLAPADPLIPWWGARRPVHVNNVNVVNASVTNVNVTNVKYVNKTYVTVVNQNTFVSGDIVQNNKVHDRTIIQRVNTAPVVNGSMPVPTRASLRGSAKKAAAPRSSAPGVSKKVVARIAPPPQPPRFEKKQQMIEANQGMPVAPVVATRLAVEQQGKERARVPVQAVAEQRGEVKLKSRGKGETTRTPQPVRAVRGRPLATPDEPVQAQQTPAEVSRPSGRPASPSQAPVEGREGRGVPHQHKQVPPGHAPSQPSAADGSQQQPGSAQGKQQEKPQQQNKKQKGGQPKDPDATEPQ